MFDPTTAALMAAAAFLLLALWGFAAARGARAEAERLRSEGAALMGARAGAEAEAQVARAALDGQARLVAERDGRIAELAAEVAGLRGRHEEARGACAEAESRCAKAEEAVGRLEAAALRLREDHAETLRVVREEGAAMLAAVRAEGQRTAERLRSVEDEFSKLGAAHAALQSERDQRVASAEREVQRLAGLREEMTNEFKALAAATLKDTGAQVSEANQAKLTELLTPFREQVRTFETELRAVHQEADKDRALLAQQIVALQAQAQAVSQDAANLARALKGDKQRQGAWGEAQLERYLELIGFRRDVDFTVQSSVVDEEGARKRPDLVLRLPGEKTLVIDSKVSLSAYAEAVACEDEAERDRWLRLHAQNVRDRIDELADRNYQGLVDGSIDMVMLFMPIEGAVSAAWALDGEIAAHAMKRGVGLVYPTSLLMALKTVKHLWNVEKRNKNAEAIAERAGRLYDKLANFIESFEAVGRALETARSAHEKARGQLSKGNGNLVRQVEGLKDLGARTGKSLGLVADGEAEEPRILGLPGPEEDGPQPTHPPGALPAE